MVAINADQSEGREVISSFAGEIYEMSNVALDRMGLGMEFVRTSTDTHTSFSFRDGEEFYTVLVHPETLIDTRTATQSKPSDPINIFGKMEIFVNVPDPSGSFLIPERLYAVTRRLPISHKLAGGVFKLNRTGIDERRKDFSNGKYRLEFERRPKNAEEFAFCVSNLQRISFLLADGLNHM